ncbi:hypothetical protein BGZ96_003666, partial [Linnemannia gamsii]
RSVATGRSEEDGLDAARDKIDHTVRELSGAKVGEVYNKNQSVVYCRAERIQRDLDEGKVVRNRGQTNKDDNSNKGDGGSSMGREKE